MKIVILSLLFAVAFGKLDVTIDLISQSPLAINFTVSNPTSTDQTFLQRGTPFEGIWTDMFEIRNEKFERLDYVGMIMFRGPVPIESEYITIPAGDMKTVIVDLGENYEFTSVGKYMVRVDMPEYSELIYSSNDNQVEVFQLETVPTRSPVGAPEAWTNCNNNQISQTNAAISTSITACSRSVSCLNSGCDALYRTWFGGYSDSNWNHVTNVFRLVHTRLQSSTFNGYCNPSGCGSNTFGYVYPTDNTFTVHLCSLFWSMPNERQNTIIHEISHFRTLGGTQDYAYGESPCKSLASSNPNNACRNADNICYFAWYV